MNLHFTEVSYPKAREGEAGLSILYMPLEKLQLRSEKRSNFGRLTFQMTFDWRRGRGIEPVHANTDGPEGSDPSHAEILSRAPGRAVTDPADHQKSVEPVSRAFIREEKLLRFISPAAIHFSKGTRQRYCCYSNSRATGSPSSSLELPWVGSDGALVAEHPLTAP